MLARLGGDEFAVILPKEDMNGARLVANALLECIRAEGRSVDAGRGKAITASIGVAMFDDEERLSGEDVLVNADLAMYDAKEAGRDRVAFYSNEDHSESRMKGRIKWVDQIRRALDEDGFTLLAQPIADLDRRAVQSLRAAAPDAGRRRRPDPARHLPLHRRAPGLGEGDRPLGLAPRDPHPRRAARPGPRHRPRGEPVRRSRSATTSCWRIVESGLRETGVDPSRLTFEITETAAVANIAKARAFAERLSELGCKFALDDFGAGFGSFYYLKHLPFDFLKIDGEFVKGCASSETDRLLIEAVVGIARGMGKRTIAEFVGNEDTVRTLRRLGVDLGQGYHLGRPEPLETLLGAPAARQ